jgi:putative transposase
MPGYLDRRSCFPVEVPYALITRSLPEPRETRIPEDDFAPEVSCLPPATLRAFYDHDFRTEIAEACRKRGWVQPQPQHLRIVPLNRGVRLEAVVRIPSPYPAGSFLAGLVEAHGAALKGLKDDRARDAWLLRHLGGLGAGDLPRIAGIDLGQGNLASVAYSTGHRAAVHTGGRFTARLEEFTRLISERVSALTPERVRVLQARKLALTEQGQKPPALRRSSSAPCSRPSTPTRSTAD